MTRQIRDTIEVDGVEFQITRPWFKRIYNAGAIKLEKHTHCTACYRGMAFEFKVVDRRVVLHSVYCCPAPDDTALVHDRDCESLDWDHYSPLDGRVRFSGRICGKSAGRKLVIIVDDGKVVTMHKTGA